jgi:MYND finger
VSSLIMMSLDAMKELLNAMRNDTDPEKIKILKKKVDEITFWQSDARGPGFAQIVSGGKIKGAEAVLIMTAVGSYYDALKDYSPSSDSLPLPFFDKLSPHHQLSVLVELCIGLFDPASPPPRDTMENYSAFYAMYLYVRNKIEYEVYEEEDFLSSSIVPPSIVPSRVRPYTSETVEERKLKFEHEMDKIQEINVRHARAKKKVERAIRHQARTDLDITPELVGVGTDSYTPEDVEKFKETVQKSMKFFEEEEEENAPEEKYEMQYYWRKLFSDVCIEGGKSVLFSYHSTDMDIWDHFFNMRLSAAGIVMSEQDRFLMNGSIEYYSSLLNDERLLKRCAIVSAKIEAATRSYERTWTPQQTLFDTRAIQVMETSLTDNRPLLVPNSALEGQVSGPTETVTVESLIESYDSNAASGVGLYTLRIAAKMLWLNSWHGVLADIGYDYRRIEHSLAALRQVCSDTSLFANNLPDWVKATGLLSNESNECISPVNWRKESLLDDVHGCSYSACPGSNLTKEELALVKHKFCGACQSAAYCAVECQRLDWPKHKVRCRIISDELKK